MKVRKAISKCAAVLFILAITIPVGAQKEGLQSIHADDMRFHMRFLSADEFRGRNTPSVELKIASRYIALTAEKIGLKPLMPDGSYYQEIPLEVTKVSEAASTITLTTETSKQTFSFAKSFGVRGRYIDPGRASGEVVFLGLGIHASEFGWDDYGNVDLTGKIAVFLDVPLPDDHVLKPRENRRLFWNRGQIIRERGAVAILTVINEEREQHFAEKRLLFDNPERARVIDTETAFWATTSPALYQIEIRHELAAEILRISETELTQLFKKIAQGSRVDGKEVMGQQLDIAVQFDTRKGETYNVVATIEGSDPKLKDEYVLFGSHHDGIGYREERIFNGADDNISGVAAMFELAEAMMIEKPKRSVIFVWHTGEEKGLYGAHYFVAHSPVPVEKMSAELNMDMLCRNDPNSIYLIGSNKLSSEFDKAIHEMNDAHIHMNLDYEYEDPGHPDRFFFRSDQYPYIRYGVPGVWFFCGTTEDYHQETDTEEKADYQKMEKVTKLVYLTAMEIGNRKNILKLDVNDKIKTRGKHNLEYNWRATLEQNR
ncbi:MAG: M28 family peptidase [bacterium]